MKFREVVHVLFSSPGREYVIAVVLVIALLQHYLFEGNTPLLWVGAIIGSIVPILDALLALRARTVTIEVFNMLALFVSYATGEITSAAFIALMLTFASYLDWRTESRATNAVEELLKLKPDKANREKDGGLEEISSDDVALGDVLVVKTGERIPVDGVVIFGSAFVSEASLTGESAPIEKIVGDSVYSSTLAESGVIKIRATKVGEDSTIARMARLIAEAGNRKSKAQRLADKFTKIFLPVVVVVGAATYLVTGDIRMTAAFFLIVCADDIAVSIPLAMTASLGYAAKRGVIVKGGEWMDVLARVRTVIFDKTGTLTYGNFVLEEAVLAPEIEESRFWKLVAIAEKFSEHPVGRAIFKEAIRHDGEIPDPDEIRVMKGVGVWARFGGDEIVMGNGEVLKESGLQLSDELRTHFDKERAHSGKTVMLVFINKAYAGMLSIADMPREEAKESIRHLETLGIRVVMLTGDNESVAKEMCARLGIRDFRANMTPEGKLREIDTLTKSGLVAMVGDGVNDAPALARADVGIAMGAGGAAVAVEAADIVILADELDRIPEMVRFARRTVSIVNLDMVIWGVTNAVGVFLVFAGIAGPAFAAFYNFATDFLPLLNSARLFRNRP